MASRLFGTKPLPEPADVLSIGPLGTNFGEILIKLVRLQTVNHFATVSMSQAIDAYP